MLLSGGRHRLLLQQLSSDRVHKLTHVHGQSRLLLSLFATLREVGEVLNSCLVHQTDSGVSHTQFVSPNSWHHWFSDPQWLCRLREHHPHRSSDSAELCEQRLTGSHFLVQMFPLIIACCHTSLGCLEGSRSTHWRRRQKDMRRRRLLGLLLDLVLGLDLPRHLGIRLLR